MVVRVRVLREERRENLHLLVCQLSDIIRLRLLLLLLRHGRRARRHEWVPLLLLWLHRRRLDLFGLPLPLVAEVKPKEFDLLLALGRWLLSVAWIGSLHRDLFHLLCSSRLVAVPKCAQVDRLWLPHLVLASLEERLLRLLERQLCLVQRLLLLMLLTE